MYGKKLKEIRTKWALTQDKMAEVLNISARTYTSYEREENNPPYSMLVNLCKEHNINLNWFIADIGEMFNANAQQFEQERDVFTQIVHDLINKELEARGL